MTYSFKPLTTLAAAALLACTAVYAPAALAEAPMVKAQAPGYHRVMLGDFEVTSLSDGTVKLPMLKLLAGSPPEVLADALKRGFLKEMVETSVNAYLINTGSKLVLIDTGAAGLFGPTLGNLLNSLKASGYKPEQVDEIYITHMHPDHVGGLMSGGAMAFPNATVRMDKADSDYWLSDANLAAAPADGKGFFQGAMASVNPYVKVGKVKPFSGNTELVPGVRAQSSYGHTPGHTTYVVESKGEKLVLWGDLMHVAAVQFDDPSVTIAFDTNSKVAQEQRMAAYADAAKNGYMVGVTHVSFPGLGNLRTAPGGKGFVWVPLNYASMC
jgi:glyoxylase-like metal-dependent hydrolase (beta-lactamase superfamily II)